MHEVVIIWLNQFSLTDFTYAAPWRANNVAGWKRFNAELFQVGCATDLFANKEFALGRIHQHHEGNRICCRRESMSATWKQDNRNVPHRFISVWILASSKCSQFKRFLDCQARCVDDFVRSVC